jgi:hypothetical protein
MTSLLQARAFGATRSVRKRRTWERQGPVTEAQLVEINMVFQAARQTNRNSANVVTHSKRVNQHIQKYIKNKQDVPASVWYQAIDLLARIPNMERIKEYFQLMKKQDVPISASVQLAVLKAHRKLDNLDSMLRVIRAAKEADPDFEVSAPMLNEVFQCLYQLTAAETHPDKILEYRTITEAILEKMTVQNQIARMYPTRELFDTVFAILPFPGVEACTPTRLDQVWSHISTMVNEFQMLIPADWPLITELILADMKLEGQPVTEFGTAALTTLSKHNLATLPVVTSLLSSLHQQERTHAMMQVFDALTQTSGHGVKATQDTFALVMRYLSEAGDAETAMDVQHELQFRFPTKANTTGNAQLTAQAESGEVPASMLAVAAAADTSGEDLLALYRRFDEAAMERLQAFQEAQAERLALAKLTGNKKTSQQPPLVRPTAFPSRFVAYMMVDKLIMLQQPGKLLEFLASVKTANTILLSQKSYQSILAFFARCSRKNSDKDYAVLITQLLLEMKKDHIVHTVAMHNALIIALAHSGRFQSALDVEAVLQKAVLMPDAYTFAAWLEACGVHGDLQMAKLLWERMQGIYDILPNEGLYTAYVSAHLTCNRLLDAIKIYDAMRQAFIDPTHEFCIVFVDAITRLCRAAVTVSPDSEAFTVYLDRLAEFRTSAIKNKQEGEPLSHEQLTEFDSLLDESLPILANVLQD